MKPIAVAFIALLGFLPAAPVALAEVATSQVTIVDGADLLSDAEEQELAAATAKVNLPDSVAEVVYLTFGSNDDNLNDTVRYYSADNNMQSADGQKYADGLLIVSVGMDPRRMGVYCGDDVCRDTEIYNAEGQTDDARTSAIIDAMRPLLQQEKWEQGMLRGAQAAADTGIRNENKQTDSKLAAIVGAFSVAIITLGVSLTLFFFTRKNRKKKVRQAREDYDYILAHHGDIAGRLQEIDVRAHSLSSPLANDELRRQWNDIRDKFLRAHNSMDSLGSISSNSPDQDFGRKAHKLAGAREAVEQAVNAEANIEQLARMEHGDFTVRRAELTELHRDVLAAVSKAKGRLANQLEEVDQRVLALRANLEDPHFMDRYCEILGDYKVLIQELTTQLYQKSKTTQSKHTPATLGSTDWHPGLGYYYVPFYTVNAWHSADVATAQAASSSFSSGYSSAGFSGGGGSGSF